jgi:hypothetical protein
VTNKIVATLVGFCLSALFLEAPMAMDKPILQGGVQMGYTLGQNGQPWPPPFKDPLKNQNRGGFYLSQARLKVTIPFDSTFFAVIVGNFIGMDPQEAYLQKSWGIYRLKAGKFRGAGLKSGSGTDEFERIAINASRFARVADWYKRTLVYRDFGIQLERGALDGNLQQRLFFRNANRQNVFNDEPSYYAGPITQALGFDYALDWRISPYTLLGAQVGALANTGYDEFLGAHDGWEVGYWLKSNAVVDGSLYHQMDFAKLHILNEGTLILDRQARNPVDSSANQIWGVASTLRLDHTAKWGSFYKYEFLDGSDGLFGKDNLHMITVGAIWHPSPVKYPNLKMTSEYVRSYEEGVRNLVANDLFYIQYQMLF